MRKTYSSVSLDQRRLCWLVNDVMPDILGDRPEEIMGDLADLLQKRLSVHQKLNLISDILTAGSLS